MEIKGFIQKNQKIILFTLSVLVFALQNPVLSWLTFTPLLFLVKKLNGKSSFLAGGLYGAVSYTFYVPWLLKFSIPSMLLVQILYFILCGLLCELLYFSLKLPKKNTTFYSSLSFTFLRIYQNKRICRFQLRTYGLYSVEKSLYDSNCGSWRSLRSLCPDGFCFCYCF